MFYDNIIRPFIREVEKNPDKTAARIGGKIITNSQIAQLVAPIMNELDALSLSRVGILVEPELDVCAALLACAFNGITAVPVSPALSEAEIQNVKDELQIPEILTAQRMHYYYRMTFEDALCRIDNGLYSIPDDSVICSVPGFDGDGKLRCSNITAGDFELQKHFTYAAFFRKMIPQNPEICSIF